jgi:hypothetical protein
VILVGAALFCLAIALRLHDFADLPIHRDWAWFLRSAGAHAVGAEPASNHAFLYTSVPVVVFGKLLASLGLKGALILWGILAAAAAPLTAAAVWRKGGGKAVAWSAVAAGAIIAVSPAEVSFGRGIESPYLATSLVAIGLLGLRVAVRGGRWGFVWMVGAWSLAAGMHVGLVGLVGFAGGFTMWHAARLRERHGGWREAAIVVGCGALAGLPALAIVLRFDVGRLLSDVLLLSNGAGAGYAGDGVALDAQVAAFGLVPSALLAVALLGGLGLVLTLRSPTSRAVAPERPGSCVGPLGMDPPGLSPPNHPAPSPVDPE